MKTEKTAIVTLLRVNHRQFQSKDLMHVHYIEFNNGDQGEYFSVSPQCPEFSLNEMVKYTIQQRGMLGNKPTYNISPVNKVATGSNAAPQRQPNGGGEQRPPFNKTNAFSKPQRNENAIMAQHAVSKAMEAYNAGGIGLHDVKNMADDILQYTIKRGMMSNEEILALPVKFVIIEQGESTGKRKTPKARAVEASAKSNQD